MRSVLCVDIGGTRIKAAILPERIDLEILKARPVCAIRTLGWLNRSLPEIISPNNWASVIGRDSLSEPYTEIAIDVPGPVENGRFCRSDLSVPVDLRNAFRKYTDSKITLVKDADAWIIGAIAYFDFVREIVEYPALALIFGTGVGASVAYDHNTFISLEISKWATGFPRLEAAAGRAIRQRWEVHKILGKRFFQWVDEKNRDWNYEDIRNQFTKRVVALVQDLIPALALSADRLSTLIIGGGNAEFVSARTLTNQTGTAVKSLWSRRIPVNPDLIPLLGLQTLAFDGGRIRLG